MKDNESKQPMLLVATMVAPHIGERVISLSRKAGAQGGTVFQGSESVVNPFLNWLGIDDDLRDIVLNIVTPEVERVFYELLDQKLKLSKPGHGIAITIPITRVVGITQTSHKGTKEDIAMDGLVDAVIMIAEQGSFEDVVKEARRCGAPGATLVHARGAATEGHHMLFDFPIEPEKDLILILSPKNKTGDLVESLTERFMLKQPGRGIIFTLEVSQALGLTQAN